MYIQEAPLSIHSSIETPPRGSEKTAWKECAFITFVSYFVDMNYKYEDHWIHFEVSFVLDHKQRNITSTLLGLIITHRSLSSVFFLIKQINTYSNIDFEVENIKSIMLNSKVIFFMHQIDLTEIIVLFSEVMIDLS